MIYLKYYKVFENNSNDYFDMNSLNNYLEFDKPLYSIVAKRRTAKLLYMSPKQYIFKIAHQFGISYDDALIPVSDDTVDKYAKMMKDGIKFDIGYFTRDNSLQEGRHRALAAMKLGCDEIPIVELINLNNEDFIELVNKFKGFSFDELNELFKKMGFSNGITRLGYNDLQRYIEYNT